MLELQQQMFGDRRRLYDHHTLLTRAPGFEGQGWHSHDYPANQHGGPLVPELPELQLIRNLVYPDGFEARNDGGLKVVGGG
jgi:hypothetical protein